MGQIYRLDDEALCALIDIARFGKVDVVAPCLQGVLLQKLAAAAAKALFGEHCQLSDIENEEGEVIGLEDIELAVHFSRLNHLPKPLTIQHLSEKEK